MQTAIINGKPSLYITPVTLVPVINPSDYASAFVGIATEMATETEPTDFDFENDPEVQAELNAWYASMDTPEAFEAYDAWVTEQERIAIEQEEADFEAHLCSQYDSEIAELASLGDAYAKDLNSCDEFHGGAMKC